MKIIKNGKEVELDVVKLFEDYINTIDTIRYGSFLKKKDISKMQFSLALRELQEVNPKLYETFEFTVRQKVESKLEEPVATINKIVEGITTGFNEDGTEFTLLDFYKLAPYKGHIYKDKDLEGVTRTLSIEYPHEPEKFGRIKQEHRKELEESTVRERDILLEQYKSKIKTLEDKGLFDAAQVEKLKLQQLVNSSYTVTISYADLLYLFTIWMIDEESAKVLREYTQANDIKNLTPIYRSSEVRNYDFNSVDLEGLRVEDVESIFDEIERCEYPSTREVYKLLRKKKIEEKKAQAQKGVKTLSLENNEKVVIE